MPSTSYFYQYLFVGFFFFFALVFAIAPLALAWLMAPKKPSADKQATYECGLASQGDPWMQYHVQYYLYALIFVIFDIETIFIYPWAVAFNKLGLFAFVEMALFIVILSFWLIYAWKKKMLEWD